MRRCAAASFTTILLLLLTLLAAGISAAQVTAVPKSKAPLTMVLGQPRSVQVAKAFGVLADTLPIIVPPGRHDVQPHLALSYSSGGGNGILGIGWDLNLGYIELNRRNGLPASGNPDTYDFSFAGLSGELRNDGTGLYRSSTEMVYREFRQINGGWEMRDGQGNRYTFDAFVPGALWLLTFVDDPSGNRIGYVYTQDEGAWYPETIYYTASPTNLADNKVVFTYEARPDVRNSYQHGVSETRALRLASIEADSGPNGTVLARRYQFTYGQTSNGQSTLSQITLVGDDDTSTIPLRSKLTYSDQAEGWNTTPVSGPGQYAVYPGGADTGARFIDIDGDGCADWIESTALVVSIGDCKGNFNYSQAWSTALFGTGGVNLPPIVTSSVVHIAINNVPTDVVESQDNGIRILDLNGDGRADIMIVSGGRTEVWLNTYNGNNAGTIGWAKAPGWSFPSFETNWDRVTGQWNCSGARNNPFYFSLVYQGTDWKGNAIPAVSTGVNFVDVNGDGLPDLVWSLYQSYGDGNYCFNAVYLNTGSGWVRNNALSTALGQALRGSGPDDPIVDFMLANTVPNGYILSDVNGDGKADILFGNNSYGQVVYLFTGAGWSLDPGWTVSLQNTGVRTLDSSGNPTGFQAIDFNHDGLPDIIVDAWGFNVSAFKNTGTGWVEDPAMEQQLAQLPTRFLGENNGLGANLGIFNTQTATLADINGDGIPDVLDFLSPNLYLSGACPQSSGFTGCVTSASGTVLPPGLLTFSETALGEYNYIQYDRAASLPLPLFVPTTLIRTEARKDTSSLGGAATYSYKYLNPVYTDRRFLGFNGSLEFQPSGNEVFTQYAQSVLLAGQEVQVTIADSTQLFRYSKANQYQTLSVATGQQGALISTDEIFNDPGPNGTNVSYSSHFAATYDDRLNTRTIYKNPNTSVTGLDTITNYGWTRNDSQAIWSLPFSQTVYKGATQSLAAMLSNTTMSYDTVGRMTAESEAVQVTTPVKYVTRTMTYDQYGNVAGVVDRNGNTLSFVYDTATSTNRVSATDQNGHTVLSSFDSRFGSVLTDTDASGNVTSYQYDPFGRLASVSKPGDAGPSTRYTYGALPPTEFGYVQLRQDSTSTGILNSASFFDAFGQIYQSINSGSNGNINVTTDYDDMSLPIRVSRPFFGDSPSGYTTITRDAMHRIAQIQDPDGLVTTRSYAALQVTETDRRGLATVTLMNPAGQVTAKTLPTANGTATTQYVYDALNRLTQVIRADGSVTAMTYDMLGRKTSMNDPNTGNFKYQYDNEGHLTATTGPDGKTIRYAYNGTGDLVSRSYSSGNQATITYGVTGQTNAVGRVVKVTDPAGSLQFTYDARGRVASRKRYVSAKEKSYLTQYAYDPSDHLLSLTYPDGYVVNYAYDAGGNVASVTDGSGVKVASNFGYTASGRLTGLQFGNGTSSGYTYDALDRMISLQTTAPSSATVQNLRYAYDADSNVVAIQDTVYGNNQVFSYDPMNRLVSATGVGYGNETYSYDNIGNLLTKGSSAFVMDPLHPERATCMLINASNLYSNPATACAQGAFGTTAINYDVRGNVVQMGSMQYSYDSENRLVSESSGGSVMETNVYDFWGDRVVQRTAGETRVFIDDIYEEGANGISHHIRTPNLLLATVVTPYTHTNAKLLLPKNIQVAELRRGTPVQPDPQSILAGIFGLALFSMILCSCLRVDGDGRRLRLSFALPRISTMPARTGALVLVLVFSLMSYGVMDGWARPASPSPAPSSATPRSAVPAATTVTPPQWYYYHLNHLGGVNLVSDGSGKIVAQREYKPYGDMYTNSGPGGATLPFAFDGQRMDGANSPTTASTGLYYFNSRFYSPLLGRFLSADSVMEHPTVPQALHRYGFGGGNPVRYVDPSGHSWWDFLIGGLIVLGIVLLIAATGGAAAGFLALTLAGVGLGIGAFVAIGLHHDPTSDAFWQIALTGAILGAGIGGGLGAALVDDGAATGAAGDLSGIEGAEGEPVVPKALRPAINSVLKSMAFGGPQAVMVHELNGGGTDGLLRNVWESELASAATGLATAGEPQVLKTQILKMAVVQGALWSFAGVEKQGLGRWLILDQGSKLLHLFESNSPHTYSSPNSYYSSGFNPAVEDPTPY